MENFVFSSRAKTVTSGFALLGLLCLIASYFVDGGEGHHMRFWTNLLHNSVFFLGIGFIASFAYCAFTTAYAGWFVQFKRVWEGMSHWMLYGLICMGVIIVGLWLHSHHLYHWNDAAAVDADPILSHKSAFLNKYWYTFGTIGFVAVWIWFMGRITAISRDEDKNGTTDYEHHARIKKYAAPFLIIAGFTSAALIWQWIMSIDSHWYSTMFAWYASASLFVAMTALTIMVLIYLKSRGYYDGITAEHFHDLGKYLFAISIFWTYVWFSQFMLIWYGNVGEETIYFRERMDNYPVLFWGNLLLNFILPFFILMRNDTKRKFGTLFFAAAIVFFGHWFDYFSMIKPGARLALIEMEAHHGGDHHGEEHATMDAEHAADHGDEHHADDHHEGAHAGADHGEMAMDNHGGDHGGEGHGHALEFKSGYTLPGLLEIGTFLGFLGGFLFLLFNSLTKAPLEPKRDPYMEESLHHHT
ncbi:MAG: hypothetical protein AAFZ52_11055 [Bacteroidota bacterium]